MKGIEYGREMERRAQIKAVSQKIMQKALNEIKELRAAVCLLNADIRYDRLRIRVCARACQEEG